MELIQCGQLKKVELGQLCLSPRLKNLHRDKKDKHKPLPTTSQTGIAKLSMAYNLEKYDDMIIFTLSFECFFMMTAVHAKASRLYSVSLKAHFAPLWFPTSPHSLVLSKTNLANRYKRAYANRSHHSELIGKFGLVQLLKVQCVITGDWG